MGDPIKMMPEEITAVVQGIVDRFSPAKIYMFSNKRGEKGRTTSFKLCVIMEHESRHMVEHDIYIGVESAVPFDVVLYSPGEWQELCERKGSFAQKVANTGVLLYG